LSSPQLSFRALSVSMFGSCVCISSCRAHHDGSFDSELPDQHEDGHGH
jgi:hypothetical protein